MSFNREQIRNLNLNDNTPINRIACYLNKKTFGLILTFLKKKTNNSLGAFYIVSKLFTRIPLFCSVSVCGPCGPVRLKLDSPQNLEGSQAQELMLLGGVRD